MKTMYTISALTVALAIPVSASNNLLICRPLLTVVLLITLAIAEELDDSSMPSDDKMTDIMLAVANYTSKLDDFTAMLKDPVKRVNIDAQDSDGFTALVWAIKRRVDRTPEFAKALLDAGANPNLYDAQGRTALIFAASLGAEICLKHLLANSKTDVNFMKKDGPYGSALHCAVENGEFEIMKLLLQSCADPHLKNKENKTSLDLADESNPKIRPFILRWAKLKTASETGACWAKESWLDRTDFKIGLAMCLLIAVALAVWFGRKSCHEAERRATQASMHEVEEEEPLS